LDEEGVVSKLRTAADGSRYGRKSFSPGALYLMLQNRIYRGEIVHKGTAYPGEHAAIVDEDLWSSVQLRLEANGVERREGQAPARPNLLTGVLFDASGQAMTPTHAVKKDVRYRYYVSRRLVTGIKSEEGNRQTSGQRIPAANLEGLVVQRLRSFFADPVAVIESLPRHRCDAPSARQRLVLRRCRRGAVPRRLHRAGMAQGIPGRRSRGDRPVRSEGRCLCVIAPPTRRIGCLGDRDTADVDHRDRTFHPGAVRAGLWPLRHHQADEPPRLRLEEAGIRAGQDRHGNPAQVHRRARGLAQFARPGGGGRLRRRRPPTHQCKPSGRWMPRGERCALPTASGRDRLNLHGAIDLETGRTSIMDVQTVDAA